MKPAVLQSRHEHEGAVYVLTLVRTIDENEGTAILDSTTPDGPALHPICEYGSWYRESSDDGPCALVTEWADEALDEFVESGFTVINKLMEGVVDCGGEWGFEAWQPIGGH